MSSDNYSTTPIGYNCIKCDAWVSLLGRGSIHRCGYDYNQLPKLDSPGGDPRFYKLLDQLRDLHSRKNTDYAKGGTQGHLGNFVRVSEIKRLYPKMDWSSPLGTALDYMLKQLDAALILAATQRESVTGEGIEERLKDVATYALLGILLQESTGSVPSKP